MQGVLKEDTASGWWKIIVNGPDGKETGKAGSFYYIQQDDSIDVQLDGKWVRAELVPGPGLSSNRMWLKVDGEFIPQETPARKIGD